MEEEKRERRRKEIDYKVLATLGKRNGQSDEESLVTSKQKMKSAKPGVAGGASLLFSPIKHGQHGGDHEHVQDDILDQFSWDEESEELQKELESLQREEKELLRTKKREELRRQVEEKKRAVKQLKGILAIMDDNVDYILSRHLSKSLDYLGYSRQMRDHRRAAYQEHDTLHNITNHVDYRITSGSKGEGVTKPFESDYDYLFIYNKVVCVEENIETNNFDYNMIVFKMNTHLCYPGYTLLSLAKIAPTVPTVLFSALSPFLNGQYYLSSHEFSESCNQSVATEQNFLPDLVHVHGRSGPAISMSIGLAEFDKVYSLRCWCPSILNKWIIRHRQHEWPPITLRHQVLQIGANLVATACKDSQTKTLEWRICFNEIELLLMHSLNDTLTKVYVLLKLILKTILKPKEKEITSYVMKNIVFWLAEMNPQNAFEEKDIIHWTFKALRLLKRSIQTQYLPYFMIPDRNLIERTSPFLKNRMLRRLTCIIHEGPCMLWRSKKFKVTTMMTHVELRMFCAKRDELEMLWHMYTNYQLLLIKLRLPLEGILNDEKLVTVNHGITDLIRRSYWTRFLNRKLDECRMEEDQVALILS